MDKLQMAHEYAKVILESGLRGDWDLVNLENVAADAFILADAIQVEADKRKQQKLDEVRKGLKEGWLTEKEGEHFEDEADIPNRYSSSEGV